MSDQQPQDRKLSEIGHLFLSSIRQKASNGGPPPRRTPPPAQRAAVEAVELTAEEIAQVGEETAPAIAESKRDSGGGAVPEITALLASHLNGKQLDRAREYARHLTADGSRIGMIEVDASEFRLMCFDASRDEAPPEPPTTESFDPRRMTEALDELSCEVGRWLLLVPTPRAPEARAVLREVTRWVMLCTCDHDGVVAGYRTLKGMSDLWPADAARPRLSLALLDSADEEHAQRIAGKISGACADFLKWPVESAEAVKPVGHGSELLVLSCRPLHDKTQVAAAPQWGILSGFVARSKSSRADEETGMDGEEMGAAIDTV